MQGISKSEIEKEISGKGNFVKINYLTRFLKESGSMDVKKFIFLKLAEVYESIGMLKDAAKNYGNAGMISMRFSEKIRCFVKEAEIYIKAGDYEMADKAMRKAMGEANSLEKKEIRKTIMDFYREQATKYENGLKRAHASKIYEKLLRMNIGNREKREIREKLMKLYDKLNRRKDYLLLKKRLHGQNQESF